MPTIKIRYKKDRKVFVPDREVDLPDNFEVELPGISESREIDQKKIKDDFIKYSLQKYSDKSINDIDKELLDLIGINAEHNKIFSYKDDKKRIMEAIWEKYHND